MFASFVSTDVLSARLVSKVGLKASVCPPFYHLNRYNNCCICLFFARVVLVSFSCIDDLCMVINDCCDTVEFSNRENIARIANAVPCHSLLKAHYEC